LADFDNIDEDNDKDDNNPWDIIYERDEAAILPESRQLSMPSTWTTNNDRYWEMGFNLHFREVELTLHMNQADSALNGLRETIADKSFQYSHVIRVAPCQVICTRARTAIAKLNHTIVYLCRVYSRCCTAMVALGADDSTLTKYRIIVKEDVKTSTALLNPNEPSSSQLRLSWIWQTGSPSNTSNVEELRECECTQ